MVVDIPGQSFRFVRLELSPDEIPGLLASHAASPVRGQPSGQHDCSGAWSSELEQFGRALANQDFEAAGSMWFASEVILWGRGHRILGRFQERNRPEDIACALREANAHLFADEVTEAVRRLTALEYLGQSYASKLARFLAPTKAVILDEVIRSAIGYREDDAGYGEFLADCNAVLNVMKRRHPGLRICDIEAAIYMKIKER